MNQSEKQRFLELENRAERAEAERDALLELLEVEQKLALRQDAFVCSEIECPRFNKPIRAGECKCHQDKAWAHRNAVRIALDK